MTVNILRAKLSIVDIDKCQGTTACEKKEKINTENTIIQSEFYCECLVSH